MPRLLSQSGSGSESSASSGDYLTPWQQQIQGMLFPGLLDRLKGSGQKPDFGTALAQTGGQTANFSAPFSIRPTPDYPGVTVGPIWDDNQIQGRVNLMRGGNDATTEGQVRRVGESAAGRGFGSNSPLAQALQTNLRARNTATNTEGENNLRWTAAEGNAQQQLRTELANLSRSQMMDQSDLARSATALQDNFRRQQAAAGDDVARRQLALGRFTGELSANTASEGALLNAIMSQLRPFQKSQSQQKGGSFNINYGPPSMMELGGGDYY